MRSTTSPGNKDKAQPDPAQLDWTGPAPQCQTARDLNQSIPLDSGFSPSAGVSSADRDLSPSISYSLGFLIPPDRRARDSTRTVWTGGLGRESDGPRTSARAITEQGQKPWS